MKFKAIAFLFGVLVAFNVQLPSPAFGTDIQGDIWGSWNPDNNPYNIIGDVRIQRDSLLYIYSGCRIIFGGHFRIQVDSNATLIASGNLSDSIIFTCSDTVLGWAGIRFYFADSLSNLSFCRFENGYATGSAYGAFGGALFLQNSPISITNCLFKRNRAESGGGLYCYRSDATIAQNKFLENRVDRFGGGLKIRESNPVVSGNLVISNNSDFEGGGVDISDSRGFLDDNYIANNDALRGGGIHVRNSSTSFAGNTIGLNAAEQGGGLYLLNSAPIIGTSNNPCNVYDNSAGSGNDIFFQDCPQIEAYFDTFTVINPDEYFIYPVNNIIIHIAHGYFSPIYSDAFVSPNGDNHNDGLTPATAVKNIRNALSRALPSQSLPITIHLLPGIYSSATNQEQYPLNLKKYIILSGTDSSDVILDGQGNSNLIYCQTDSSITLENLKLINGHSENGGIVNSEQSSISIVGCQLSNGNAVSGGALYSIESQISIENCEFRNNQASGNGGAIHCDAGSIVISNSNIDSCIGAYGGGIFADSNFVVLDNNRILGNHALINGGGIYARKCDNSDIMGNILSSNQADSSFGGAYLIGESLNVAGNQFISNNARYYGGGLGFISSEINLIDNIISENTGGSGGGIALKADFHAQIGPNLITGNRANGHGGGVYCLLADVDFLGTNISFNSAYDGGGIYRDGGAIISIGSPLIPCNIYSNYAGKGNDLFASGNPVITAYIDTFTMESPDQQAVYLLNNFDMHIEQGYYEPIYQDIYVNPNGDNFNTGSSPETPLKNISVAAIRAQSNPRHLITIHLAPGIYSRLSNEDSYPINVKSGAQFIGDEPDSCILDAANSSYIFALYQDTAVSLTNLTLQNSTCAAYVYDSYLIEINNNIFKYNTGSVVCGGIYGHGASININHNVFHDNSWPGGGCGGAVSFLYVICRMANNVFYHNYAGNSGGALFFQISNILGYNNIFWADSSSHGQSEVAGSGDRILYDFSYNDIAGGFNGVGNINVNPGFIDASAGNFHLQTNSPCINSGDPRSPLDPDGSRADMGTYYYNHGLNIEDGTDELPSTLELNQNYPNPFNDKTILSFRITNSQKVKLNVYDITGRLVEKIYDGFLEAGFHQFYWSIDSDSGRSLSSGIYFYELKTGGGSLQKKMILLK